MTTKRMTAGAAGAVAMCALLAGCQPQPDVRTDYALPMITAEALDGAEVAVGGVVVGRGVTLDPPAGPGADDEWAASMYGHLLAQTPAVKVVATPVLADLAGSTLVLLRREYAERGPLDPQLLAELHEAVPTARYLALGRIDADDLSYRTRDSLDTTVEHREARPSDLVHPAEPRNPPPGRRARRAVTLEFDLFDIAGGETVWSAAVERRREIVVEHFSPQKAGELEVAPPDSTGELPRIIAPTVDLKGLEIERLVDDCLGALVSDLFQPARIGAGGERREGP